MDKKIKDIGIVGFIVYILSLPIMIWKSSKIGKAISIILIGISCLWITDKVLVMVGNVYNKSVIFSRTQPLIYQIDSMKRLLDEYKIKLSNYDNILLKSEKQLAEDIKDEIMKNISKKYWKAQIEEIEKNISIIHESERDALKEKIIEIKEQVKVYNKSIDSKEIRLICENIATSFSILTPEEKDRFAQDLKDIGFIVEKIEKETKEIMVYGNDYAIDGGWDKGACVTMSSVVMYPTIYRRR